MSCGTSCRMCATQGMAENTRRTCVLDCPMYWGLGAFSELYSSNPPFQTTRALLGLAR